MMSSQKQANANRLGSIKTEILVAWIFAILVVLIWVIGFLSFFGFYFVIIGYAGGGVSTVTTTVTRGTNPPSLQFITNTYYNPVIWVGLTFGIIFLILMAPSVLVLRRTGRMRNAANKADFTTLKRLNSIGWGIIALIFTGIIPGIMLLVAHGPIAELKGDALEAISSDNLDGLAKLKSLLDSGVITKEEFDEQKKRMLQGG